MSKTLYVGNLTASATSNDIRGVFARYGTVTNARIVVDEVHGTGRSLGFGFVEMADGAEAAIAGLNGTMFQGRTLAVNEAQVPDEHPPPDRFSDVMDRFSDYYTQPESQEFREVLEELRELAESGHVEAARELADVLAVPGPNYDPESAYKWYYIALSPGYSVEFNDQNHSPPYYCGPVGDFRNECMVSDLVVKLGFDRVRSLDAEAARWLADHNLTNNKEF